MICAVETITQTSSGDFDKLLNAAISRWQDQGLEVEVQYAPMPPGRSTHRQFSALLVVRQTVPLPPPREEALCQCWNEGQYGRVHREDCPIHKDGAR